MMTTQPPWWQSAVVYQIYPRSFMDSNGDGIGDLPGVLSKLDYLQWLGVDAVWFSPIYPSPMKDFGYDVADYVDIHPDFGTLADFDALLEAAHQRGIRIILDLVPNHSSDQHPWFLESRSSRTSPKRDWYIWRDPAPDGGPPNNWLSVFGGSAWEYDEETGQYYLHNFVKEQPDFNWRSEEMAAAFFDNVRFWLDRGVDGFRIDVIDFTMKAPDFADDPPNPVYNPETDIDTGRFIKVNSAHRPEAHDLIRRFRDVFEEYEDRVSIGEIQYGATAEAFGKYFGTLEAPELHLPFNFRLLQIAMPPSWSLSARIPWNAQNVRAAVDAYTAASPAWGWPAFALGNHDMPRLASTLGEGARVGAMLLLTLRGTPFIYYGEELGMENVPIPPEKMQDPYGLNYPSESRDQMRTPMQWDSAPGAGFTTGDPWLPVAPDYAARSVATQQDDPDSMLSFYRALLAYRKAQPALQRGDYRPLDAGHADVYAYLREYDGQRRLVVLNFGGDAVTVDLASAAASGKRGFSTRLDHDGAEVTLARLALRGHAGLIIEL